jgi:hypothetical protein
VSAAKNVRLEWASSGGILDAKRGARFYVARGWYGEFHLWPPRKHVSPTYKLLWANTKGFRNVGFPVSSELWTVIGSTYKTPSAAQKAAREFVEKRLVGLTADPKYAMKSGGHASATSPAPLLDLEDLNAPRKRREALLLELAQPGPEPHVCDHCKKPIKGMRTTIHAPGKPDVHYHPHHARHRPGGPMARS